MAKTTFSGPVISPGGFEGAVTLPTFTVADAPSAADLAGTIVYVSNGAGGDPIIAFSDGSDWKRCDTGATISDGE